MNDDAYEAKVVLVGRKEVGADVLLELRGVCPHRARDQPDSDEDADAGEFDEVKKPQVSYISTSHTNRDRLNKRLEFAIRKALIAQCHRLDQYCVYFHH